ncbi:sodium:solute symporter [Formosa sp. S-31]|uniref:sodium:solute symporter n=1 Tax=Formosa sp. S-31 TaxID=2790949 RepID=UPI003EBFFF10
MAALDWIVLIGTLLTIVIYGTWKTRGSKNVEDYIRGGNQAQWWTIGLSVMATQASAITFLSTPGQAFHDGMGFVQFYFGLPIAMIIICMVFIPLYHRLKVYTAYEFLESRFDLKTRSLTALLFLIQRGLAAGITIYAPAIILSAVLGWPLNQLNIIIGFLVIIYTVSGGTKAVSVTQKHQMAVIFTGMFIAFVLILNYLPEQINFSKALTIAKANNKLNILDFSFNLENRYTFWSGIIGGTFLMLSYFGTDQSQVQRYLSGKSLKEMQLGLLFNGALKVPMQFFILLVGVMVFVFYQFNPSPIHFNPHAKEVVKVSSFANEFEVLESKHQTIFESKQKLLNNYSQSPEPALKSEILSLNQAEKENRENARIILDKAAKEHDTKIETNDKDYVFIHFILNNLPRGLIGLLLAVILSAAMSSTASELNALASTTTIDLYKRSIAPNKDDIHYVKATKWFTLAWGILAICIACIAYLADNLIQLVNIIGSIFYGNVLGIFLLAFFFKSVKSNAVFTAAIITQIIVLVGWYQTWMPYLWLNLFGCILVILIALLIQTLKLKTYESSTR